MKRFLASVLCTIMAISVLAVSASAEENYSWYINPTIEADDISVLYHYQPDLKDNPLNEYDYDYYTIGSYLYVDYVPIKVNGKWGLISYDGEILLPTEYDSIEIGFSGKMIASKSFNYYYVDRQEDGSFTTVQTSEGDDFAQVEMGTNGVHPLAWVVNDQSIHVFGEKNLYYEDRPFAAILCKYNEGGMAVNENQKKISYVLINDSKRVDMQEYEDAGNYSDGIIPVKKNGYWGYVNENGETVIPFEYEDAIYKGARKSDIAISSACNASDGFVVLCKNSEYALYDVYGNEIIPFGEFEQIRPVYNGLAWVKQGGKWGVISLDGSQTNPTPNPTPDPAPAPAPTPNPNTNVNNSNSDKPTSPKTGVVTPVNAMLGILLVSGAAVMIARKRKDSKT